MSKNNPSRHGKRWSKDEETKLFKELKDNMTIDNIADIHERTKGGIQSHIEKISVDMYNKGIDKEKIKELTKITLDEKIINKHNKSKKVIENSEEINLRQLLNEIKDLQIKLLDKFNEFRKIDKLGLFEQKEDNDS